MWTILIIFLFCFSVYLSVKLKLQNYKINIKELIRNDKTSLYLTLGTKVGVGSIIGTTSSIIIGGFSSVIWIILFSILTTSIIYYEAYLGRKNRVKLNNDYIGGPNFIVKNKLLSFLSLILLLLIYTFMFQMIQMNTISNMILLNVNISKKLILIVFLIILLVTINLKIKEILNIMNKIVPIMCLFFIIICLYGIINNYDILFSSIEVYLKDIFSIKSILCGMIIGIKRSIFMNELLIGTTSLSASTDKNDINISIKYQILSIFFITITMTLLISSLILIYIYNNPIINDYNLLINNIFHTTYGSIGTLFLIIILILFGFTTILSGFYIGKTNIEYLTKSKLILNVFKLLFIVVTLSGIIINNFFIWKYLDNLIFIMIIINSYSIIKSLGSD
ncbi:MAG: alanine:cation symporter family protein [Clostridium sp.]|nr:alanine:cation symporter family protein [Clostridium sp.]